MKRNATGNESPEVAARRLAVLGQLTAEVIHEINNLLSVVSGYTELELIQNPGGKTAENMQRISEAAARASELTHNLLRFSAPGAREGAGDLAEAVQSTIDLLDYRLQGAEDLRVTWEPQPDLPPVSMPTGDLQLVTVNLLKNALEAVEDQPGARIRITARRQDSFVDLEVWNPGPPLSDETRQHLFTPYFTTRSEQGGSGLGLWVTHRIVMQAGGRITAQNVESGGVVFRVRLPVASGPKQTAEPPPEREEVAEQVRQARVLVVDDERTVREVLRLMVREMGWTNVETCASGEEALTRLAERDYDAILLDLRMPGVSGAEVYEEIPESVRRHVVFVTGDTLNATTTRFLESTRQPTLLKPIRTGELARAVQEVLSEV